MKLIESLKAVYSSSDDGIMIADKKLNILWKNHDWLPDTVNDGRIRLFFGKELELPVEKTTTAELMGNYGESSALRIEPLCDNGKRIGYLLHVYTCNDIEKLSDRSGYLKFKSNFLGNIRLQLSKVVAMMDMNREEFTQISDKYSAFDKEARYRILKTFSATVNMNELAKYYNGFYQVKFMNISNVFADVADTACELLEENGCMFRFDIEPGIYLEMCEERLKAVLYNLLVNAYMYNSKLEKQCELVLKRENGRVIMTVKDNGDGITDEVANRSIIPFTNFNEYGQNESLGLTLAKCFCDTFGGVLDIQSKENENTTVSISLPQSDKDIPHEFHVSHKIPIVSPYDLPNCIFAKGMNPLK